MCMSYPFGYCPENEVSHVTTTMRTKEGCEEFCIRNGAANLMNNIKQNTGAANVFNVKEAVVKPILSERAPSLVLLPSKEIPSNLQLPKKQLAFELPTVATTYPSKPEPDYLCERQPYRRLCSKTVPSQFTFRWYYVNGVCLAYPFGFCLRYNNSNDAMTLRSKEACEHLCSSQKPRVPPVTPIYEFVSTVSDFPTLPLWTTDNSTSIILEPNKMMKHLPLGTTSSTTAVAAGITEVTPDTRLITDDVMLKETTLLVGNSSILPFLLDIMDNETDDTMDDELTSLIDNFINGSLPDQKMMHSVSNFTLVDEKIRDMISEWVNTTIMESVSFMKLTGNKSKLYCCHSLTAGLLRKFFYY